MSEEKSYIDQVNDWLNDDPSTRSLETGALLMLQGNKNRILHQNVVLRKNINKIVYELEKIVGSKRVFPEPVDEAVQQLEVNLPMTIAGIESVLSGESKGKRADHDTLPTEIQGLYDQNREIYPQLRAIHERLKVLNDIGSAKDRLPYLTQLLQLDEQLRNNWKSYDEFDANAPVIVEPDKKLPEGEKIDAKRVSANRKYLSDNKTKLPLLISEGKTEKAEKLLDEMQLRFNELILNGETFAPEQLAELISIGIISPTIEDLIQEPAPGTQVNSESNGDIPPAVTTDETPEENVISQIKTLLKNDVTKEVIIPTILSLGNFKGLELTPEVVEDLYNKAVDQEMNSNE